MPFVYLATNLVNGKRYVGVTSKSLAKRRWQHENDAKRCVDACPAFHAALRKYERRFSWEILGTFESLDEALRAEIAAIADLAPEYNITAGGEGAIRPWTTEQRAAQSARRMGIKFTDEHLKNLAAAHRGKKQLPETIEKRRKAWLGRSPTSEHREKIRASLSGRKRPPEVIAKILVTRAKRYPESAAKPWLAMGIHVRTWHRRRKRALEVAHAV